MSSDVKCSHADGRAITQAPAANSHVKGDGGHPVSSTPLTQRAHRMPPGTAAMRHPTSSANNHVSTPYFGGYSRGAVRYMRQPMTSSFNCYPMHVPPQHVSSSSPDTNVPTLDYPLRILVGSDMVGAIIGRHGNTIRDITQESRARVDIHRKEASGTVEKAISIYGNLENCDSACRRIFQVMCDEANSADKSVDLPLKILASNNLVGRVIGKRGAVIKRIMELTGAKISISNMNEVGHYNTDRTIIIRGEFETVTEAEKHVYRKLRQSFEQDMQNFSSPYCTQFMCPSSMYMHPTPAGHLGETSSQQNMSGAQMNRSSAANIISQSSNAQHRHAHQLPLPQQQLTNQYMRSPMFAPYGAPSMFPMFANGHAMGARAVAPSMFGCWKGASHMETCHVYVPATIVGALIGRNGSFVRSIIRMSNASVRIMQVDEEVEADKAESSAKQAANTVTVEDGPCDSTSDQAECVDSGGSSSGAANHNMAAPSADDGVISDGGAEMALNGHREEFEEGAVVDEESSDSSKVVVSTTNIQRKSATSKPIGCAVTEGAEHVSEGAEFSSERKVTIIGTPEAQWKAQYLIFDKMRLEGYSQTLSELQLPVEIQVPSNQVGRIIGRRGQNLRQLQLATCTRIFLPNAGNSRTIREQVSPPSVDLSTKALSDKQQMERASTTTLQVVGAFHQVQRVLRHIRTLMYGTSAQTAAEHPRHALQGGYRQTSKLDS